MIEEYGRVVALDGDFAWVETQRKTACGACSVNKGCGTGVISKYFGQRFSRIKAVNKIQAGEGDDVVVGLREDALVRGSLATYAAPLLAMLLMAILGEIVANEMQMAQSEGMSILFGLSGLVLGFFWLRIFSRRIAMDDRYQPLILRLSTSSEIMQDVSVQLR